MSRLILVLLLIVIFYIAFIMYSDFDDFMQSISQFRLEFLFPILGLFLVGIFTTGIRQQFLFKTADIFIPFKKSMLLYMAGLGMEITPGGAGKLIKSYYLKEKYGYSISKSLPVFIIERYYDFLALITIISFTLLFVQVIEVAILISIVSTLIITIYFTINSKTFFSFITKKLGKMPLIKKFIISLNESQEIFQSLTTKRNIAKSWSLSIIANTAYAFGIYLVFVGFNVNLDIIFTTFVTFSSFLFGILTLLPAGIGVTEIGVVGFFNQ